MNIHLSSFYRSIIVVSAALTLVAANPGAVAQRVRTATAVAVSTNYILKPNDQINIRVFRNSELDGPRRISKDGTIDFPLLGIVRVAGKTPYEAGAHLAALLDKDYLVRPQVFVGVVATTKRQFSILGQVASPGSKDFPDDRELDLLGAVAAAGGFTRLANQSKIMVRRQEEGQEKTYKVDARRLIKDKDAESFPIQPNDIIVVDERFF